MSILTKLLKFLSHAILIILGVTFAVSNRGKIDLTLFPIPYVISVPIFLFAIAVFALGCFTGWAIAHIGAFHRHRAHKQATRRVIALENELAAHRCEQLLRKPTAPLLK